MEKKPNENIDPITDNDIELFVRSVRLVKKEQLIGIWRILDKVSLVLLLTLTLAVVVFLFEKIAYSSFLKSIFPLNMFILIPMLIGPFIGAHILQRKLSFFWRYLQLGHKAKDKGFRS